MSTHSAIGIWTDKKNKQWKARYCQFDGYVKDGVGQTLYDEYSYHFVNNLQGMIDYLVTNEKVGWSVLAGKNFTLPLTWHENLNSNKNAPESYTVRGEKPTSGDPDGDWIISDDGSMVEYVYILDASDNTLSIMKPYYNIWVTLNLDHDVFDASKIEEELSSKRVPKMIDGHTFVNCTPHEINIILDDRKINIPPSGTIARLKETSVKYGEIDNIPTTLDYLGEIVDLPPRAENTIYLVSTLVLDKCDRDDVFAPGESVRDTNGRIVGCKSLKYCVNSIYRDIENDIENESYKDDNPYSVAQYKIDKLRHDLCETPQLAYLQSVISMYLFNGHDSE